MNSLYYITFITSHTKHTMQIRDPVTILDRKEFPGCLKHDFVLIYVDV